MGVLFCPDSLYHPRQPAKEKRDGTAGSALAGRKATNQPGFFQPAGPCLHRRTDCRMDGRRLCRLPEETQDNSHPAPKPESRTGGQDATGVHRFRM